MKTKFPSAVPGEVVEPTAAVNIHATEPPRQMGGPAHGAARSRHRALSLMALALQWTLLLVPCRVMADEPAAFGTWAKTAKLGGAAVWQGMTPLEVDQLLSDLVAQNVTVIEADSELSNYLTDAQFEQELDLIRSFTAEAHKRGLRVVWYYPSLEVVTPNGKNIEQTMAKEHPDWVQYGWNSTPNVFYGGSGQVFWVAQNDESAWMSPSSAGYRAYFLDRVRLLAATGVDGLWADVPIYADFGPTKWSDFNPDAVTKFESETGYAIPTQEDWNDPNWRRWIAWRHEELAGFLSDVTAAARSVDPEFPVFAETLPTDYNGGTIYGLDGAYLKHIEGLTHVWEVDSMSNNVGMRSAQEDDWISFISAFKYTRAASGTKPSWVFTYGKQADDAELVMAEAMAAGNNPYELMVPEMTTTVGADYRTRMFAWAKEHSALLFEAESAANVAVLYSSASRDYVDKYQGLGMFVTWQSGGDSLWWAGSELESAHQRQFLAEFRGMVELLVNEHVPFDTMVNPADAAELAAYETIIVPDVEAISDAEAEILRQYVQAGGVLIVTGPNPTGLDEYGAERAEYALADVLGFSKADPMPTEAQNSFGSGAAFFYSSLLGKDYFVNASSLARQSLLDAVQLSSTIPFSTDADHRVHIELSRLGDHDVLQLTNFIGVNGTFAVVPTSFSVTLDVPAGKAVTRVAVTSPDSLDTPALSPLAYTEGNDQITFDVALQQYSLVLVSYDGATLPPRNHTPIAGRDELRTDFNTPFALTETMLLDNDGDLDGDGLQVTGIDASGAIGTLTNLGGGNYLYTPPQDFLGVDTLRYAISDGAGGQDSGVLSILVAPPTSIHYPESVTVTTGAFDYGTMQSFVAVDDDTYDIISAAVSGGRQVDWYATSTISASPDSIDQIQVTHVGQYNRANVTQDFYVYNFLDSAWELVDTSTVGNEGDVPVSWTIESDVANYVSAEGQVRARVSGFKSTTGLRSWSNAFRWEVTEKVNAGPSNTPPTAAFAFDCIKLDCGFTDQSTDPDGNIVSWSWDFGDGGTSTSQHPNYSYPGTGGYQVSLTVTDELGATHETSQSLSVLDSLCGDGITDPGEGCDDGNTLDGDGCSASCQPEVCQPSVTCASAGASCGPIDDGCGGTLDCGSCSGTDLCEGNQCVCQPSVTCASAGASCGPIDDGCGGTLDCGSCSGTDLCQGNQCVCQPSVTCASAGASCGPIDDGCGGTLDCGSCAGTDLCQGNQCVCQPSVTCASAGASCGPIDDGCGGTLDCGSCAGTDLCQGNQCVCQPSVTCASAGASCGPIDDGCGGTLDCGSCAGTDLCEGNQCVCQPSVTCASAGASCGPIDDGCGGTLDCGSCAGTDLCQGNQCVCQPSVTCASAGASCGPIDDGCGGTLDCGSCAGTDLCQGNQCVCQPSVTCASAGASCGPIDDGCGGTLDCGSCSGTDLCQGNQCVCQPSVTCASAGASCGPIDDGCGGTLDCGSCAGTDLCQGNQCVPPVSSTIVIDGSIDDWAAIASSGAGLNVPDDAGNDVDLLALKMTHDDNALLVAYENESPIVLGWHYALYIDADRNPATGFSFGSIGADILVEGATVYQYTGSGFDWSWSYAGQADWAVAGNTAEIAVPRTLLGATPALDYVFSGQGGLETIPVSGHGSYVMEAGANRAPVAMSAQYVTLEATPVSFVLDGSDADGDTLSFNVETGPTNGTLSGSAPSVTYSPNPGFIGTDSIAFTVSDGTLGSAVATVSFEVLAVGTTQITLDGSLDDWASIASVGTGLDVPDAPGNDVDLLALKTTHNEDSLYVAYENESPVVLGWSYALYIDADRNAETGYAFGSIGADLLIEGSSAYQYTGTGFDWSWLYLGQVDSAVAGNTAELSIPRSLLGSGPALDYIFLGQGGVEIVPAGSGQLTYLFDGSANSAPVAMSAELVTVEDSAVSFNLEGSDLDEDPLSFNVETGPANGTLSGSAPSLTYTPNPGFIGTDSLRFTVSDGTLSSAVATVSFEVLAAGTTQITVDGSLGDWASIASVGAGLDVPDVPGNDVDLLALKMTHDDESVFVAYQNQSPIALGWHYALYIDADGDSSTGYGVGTIGADFLVEGSAIYAHTGVDWLHWSWEYIGQADAAVAGTTAEIAMPRALLGLGSSFDYRFLGQGGVESVPSGSGRLTYSFEGAP